jgi:hypothetical protein
MPTPPKLAAELALRLAAGENRAMNRAIRTILTMVTARI